MIPNGCDVRGCFKDKNMTTMLIYYLETCCREKLQHLNGRVGHRTTETLTVSEQDYSYGQRKQPVIWCYCSVSVATHIFRYSNIPRTVCFDKLFPSCWIFVFGQSCFICTQCLRIMILWTGVSCFVCSFITVHPLLYLPVILSRHVKQAGEQHVQFIYSCWR